MSDPAFEAERAEFLRDAIAGLSAASKSIPGKYLWDMAGSALFDRICRTPDYYPTREETALLPRAADAVAARIGPGAAVVEFGSGASRKIRTLLDALDRPVLYVGIDISRTYLEASIRRLAPEYPEVRMIPLCADYTKPVRLPSDVGGAPILAFYPGTSIGNFEPDAAMAFLARAREALGPSLFLVGADSASDPERLHRAYGRADGLMAAFHLNLLTRLNRELGADLDPGKFAHAVRLHDDPLRVEAHLVARKAARYRLGRREIAFAAGECLRTDVSHKYPPEAFRELAARAGWRACETWQDSGASLCLHLFEA